MIHPLVPDFLQFQHRLQLIDYPSARYSVNHMQRNKRLKYSGKLDSCIHCAPPSAGIAFLVSPKQRERSLANYELQATMPANTLSTCLLLTIISALNYRFNWFASYKYFLQQYHIYIYLFKADGAVRFQIAPINTVSNPQQIRQIRWNSVLSKQIHDEWFS